MATTWIAESYAKINLGLHVLERLPTGYHRIETGFAFLEWSDRLSVEPAESYRLKMSNEEIPTDESNLITRAIQVLERYVGLKQSYKIDVKKQIPVGAGLGGGSSNAATVLRMINKIEELGLSNEELIDLSRELGADVPFFIKGQTGIGSGIGTEIEPMDIQPNAWILTIYPGFSSDTAEAYQHCMPNPDPEFSLRHVLTNTDPEEDWRFMLDNDLEPPVVQQNHLVGNIRDQLYEFGAFYASMTGSGSAVYGLFEQDFVATNAYEGFLDLEFSSNLTRPGFKPDYGIYRKG